MNAIAGQAPVSTMIWCPWSSRGGRPVARHVSVSRFKAECLGLLEEISHTGEGIVVTKRGRPLARVEPMPEAPSLQGSVEYLVSDEELIQPIEEDWDADRR